MLEDRASLRIVCQGSMIRSSRCLFTRPLCSAKGPSRRLLRPVASLRAAAKPTIARTSLPILHQRYYAVSAEATSKGVVSLLVTLRWTSRKLKYFYRIPVTLSCKEILPITLTRCIWHGNMILLVSTSHGKPIFTTWRTEICPCLRPSNLLRRLCRCRKEEFHQPCLVRDFTWSKVQKSRII